MRFVSSSARNFRTVACRSTSMPRFWGGPAGGEVCDACDKPITEPQLIMDGIVSTRGDEKLAQFHVRCFQF